MENTYIVYDDNHQALIIDPGMYEASEFETVFQFIETQKLKPVLCVNTHTHIDHIAGNALSVQRYQIPLAFHPLDKPVFDAQHVARQMYGLQGIPSPEPDQYLDEKLPLTLGKHSFKIILCPGHSPGHVCLYEPQLKWLIGGDVLFQGSIGRTDLPGGDHGTLIRNIQSKLFTLPDEITVFPGHGETTTLGEEKENNPFVGRNARF